MMKKLARAVLALALGVTLIGSAVAGGAQYGEPPKLTAPAGNVNDAVVGYITFYNYTYDTYTTYATMSPSGAPYSAFLGARGTPQSILYYTLTYPTQTCADIAVQNSRGQWLPVSPSHLCGSYTISIGNPSGANAANGLPTVTVTKR